MPSAAKNNFSSHISQCDDAAKIYNFLVTKGYAADFGLRFVWVAAISALDNYISELVVEKATEIYSNKGSLPKKLQAEGVPLEKVLEFQLSNPIEATMIFRKLITNSVKFQTFQSADGVASGLAYIWDEQHKWKRISEGMGMQLKPAKGKLNSICFRRNAIAHNADYDMSSNKLRDCKLEDAVAASEFVKELVNTIDDLVSSL
ncbi:HEPN domain-containing protein [Sulfitobacter sp.]|uniref:HEPN domain-containing protein n=1 Tax=Sulfitobacter sp. TaxID=1903071 RepID=UPI003298DF1A